MKPLLLLLFIVLFGIVGYKEHNTTPQSPVLSAPTASSTVYTVVSVIDGDTIIVEKEGVKETVRLLGIDTPEVDPQYNPIECFGREATNATKEKVHYQMVTLATDPSQGTHDQFDRMLAYVFLPDGTHLNQYLIAEGFAKEYTFNTPYLYHTEFRTAEKDAQINEKGLWLKGRCPENS